MKNRYSPLSVIGLACCAFAAVIFTTGCELNVNADESGGGDGGVVPPPVTTNAPPPGTPPSTNFVPVTGTYDQLNPSGAVMLGPHKRIVPANARITRGGLYKADKSGDVVQMSFDPLNWPTQPSGSKTLDGRVYVFWYQGSQLVGGMFDWHAVGQTAKTLGNIHEGYLDGQRPPAGATLWFCIMNIAGSERTFITQSKTKW